MKVGIISFVLPFFREVLYEKLSSDLGWDLTVYLNSGRSKKLEREDIDHSFHIREYKTFNWAINPEFSHYPYELRISPGIISHTCFTNYDLLILPGYTPLSAQINLLRPNSSVPTVLWVRSFKESISNLRGGLKCVIAGWKRRLLENADAYVVPGKKSLDYLLKFGASPKNIKIIGNPVDNTFFSMPPDLSANPVKEDNSDIIILFVGNLSERKGLHILLSAFKEINFPDVKLAIVGGGPLKKEVLVAEKRNQNIEYYGTVPPKEIKTFYFSSDIFVLPSLYDLWGLVINEAMNAGLPIVTTNQVGAAGEIVKHDENGFIVQSGKAEALTSALKTLVKDKEKRKQMGVASKNIIESWGVSKAVKGIEQASSRAIKS